MRPLAQAIVLLCLAAGAQATAGEPDRKPPVQPDASKPANLEPRVSSFVRDIVDRLHALDADIGKLVYNSTSMYAPEEMSLANQLESASDKAGGQKFTEVLNDLDALQDEIGQMITNTTRTRQYNILVRLRPLNTLLYRIRHNLHLMRNSLVAINTVSTIERLGNNVLDSTLTAFMRPDADLNEEIGDTGNYDINLDKPEVVKNDQEGSQASSPAQPPPPASSTPSPPVNSSSAPLVVAAGAPTSTTLKQTTTTPKPTTAKATTPARPPPTTGSNSTTDQSPTTRRTTRRPNNRNRTNQRQNQRRNSTTTTTTTTTTTQKPSTASSVIET